MNRIYNFFLQLCCRSDYIRLENEDELDTYPSSKKFVPKKFTQYLASLTANIGAFALGTAQGWTSPSLPNIEARGDLDSLKANSELASWIGALTPLGCFFSGFVAGFLVDRIGRRWTMLAMAPPFVAGWLMISFAPSATWVLIGRFITGFCGGSFTLTVPIYTSEIAEDSVRGALSNAMGLATNSGILFTYIVGSFVPWNTSSFVNALFPAIFAIAMFFMPETPLYLISKGKVSEAQEALMWLRGSYYHEDVEEEMQSMAASLKGSSESVTFKDLMTPSVLKPALICLMLMLFQKIGGINGVTFYSVDIFKDAGANMDENLYAIIVAAVQVLFVFLSTIAIERLGRRILLISSEFGMTISLLVLGGYFFIKAENPIQAASLGWMPLASLIAYVMSFSFGMGPVPWTMMGELPPPKAKGVVSSVTSAFCWGLAFLITKFFKNLINVLTPYGCYWLFAACSFAGMVYCIIFVPETKGKSAMEIQNFFQNK